jgi:hypothetical protein
MPPTIVDPFADEQFAQLDLSTSPKHLKDSLNTLVDENPEFAPTQEEVIAADGPAPEPVVPPAAPIAPVVTPAQPETYEYPDGSTVTLEKTNRGWEATLNSGGKAPEIFRGKTKDELLTNVLAAKLHATQHIRELNKKIKLTAKPETPVAVPQAKLRSLTPDEVFEIKNQLVDNPDLAFDSWFQKKTGLKVEELVGLVEEGRFAKDELDSEAVAKSFMQGNPEYYADPEFNNYLTLVGFLSKEKLHRTMTNDQPGVNEAMRDLIRGGHWTVQNLEEAFEELSEAGLLEMAPNVEEEEEEIPSPAVPPVAPVAIVAPVVPVPVPPVPPAPPADPRIANTRRGLRAGLGIRESQVSTALPDTARPSSDDELDNLTDAEIQELFSGVRRVAATRGK